MWIAGMPNPNHSSHLLHDTANMILARNGNFMHWRIALNEVCRFSDTPVPDENNVSAVDPIGNFNAHSTKACRS